MNRTDRLYAIVERLRATDQPVPARRLAEHFEVSTRTIERDLLALQESGVPIYAASGRTGGYVWTFDDDPQAPYSMVDMGEDAPIGGGSPRPNRVTGHDGVQRPGTGCRSCFRKSGRARRDDRGPEAEHAERPGIRLRGRPRWEHVRAVDPAAGMTGSGWGLAAAGPHRAHNSMCSIGAYSGPPAR